MISIIVPIYNSERWLRRCIDSILHQTYSQFEILLIDDGSDDGSGKICDEYALADSRVHVIHKTNGGVSSARQVGIENAKGDYIIHIDSDDYINKNMLEELYNCAIKDKSDVVICDYYEIFKKRTEQKYVEQQPSNLNRDDVLVDLLKGKLMGSLWNKLIKKNCYENFIFLSEITYEEDLRACLCILHDANTVSYLNKALYYYVRDENIQSLSSIYSRESYINEQKVLKSIKGIINSGKLLNAFYYRHTLSAFLAFSNRVLSREEYINRYRNFIPLLMNVDVSWTIKIFSILSASGLYHTSYFLYRIARYISIIYRRGK